MSPSDSYSAVKETRNYFLVFTYDLNISPLILNDAQNSYEVFHCNSTKDLVNCFHSKRPGCLITTADNEFFSYPNLNPMSRLMPVVMVTNTSSIASVSRATKKGAHTILRDLTSPDAIREAIRGACLADCHGDLSPLGFRLRLDTLTTKERQVVYMSLRGKSTKLISTELDVCHQTVDKHKKRALVKLRAGSIVELYSMLMDSHRLAAGMALPPGTVRNPHISVAKPEPAARPEP